MTPRRITPPLAMIFAPLAIVFFIPWPLPIQAALTIIAGGITIGALTVAASFLIMPIKSLYLYLHKT